MNVWIIEIFGWIFGDVSPLRNGRRRGNFPWQRFCCQSGDMYKSIAAIKSAIIENVGTGGLLLCLLFTSSLLFIKKFFFSFSSLLSGVYNGRQLLRVKRGSRAAATCSTSPVTLAWKKKTKKKNQQKSADYSFLLFSSAVIHCNRQLMQLHRSN